MKNTLLTALVIGTTFAASQSFAQEDVEAGLTKLGVAKLGDSGYASSIRGINQAGAKAMQKNAAMMCNEFDC